MKTSTGYAPSGSTMDDLRLMRASVSERVKVKAAGGIRTLDLLIEGLNAGMDRCGATATAAIIDDLKPGRAGDRRSPALPPVTRRYLGIDVGGTNSKLAVLEAAGDRRLAGHGDDPDRDRRPRRGHRPAGRRRGPAGGRARAGGGGRGRRPRAVRRGQRADRAVPNLPPAWNGAAFREPLADRLGLPLALINDARAFTLAESRMGRPPAARPWSA